MIFEKKICFVKSKILRNEYLANVYVAVINVLTFLNKK